MRNNIWSLALAGLAVTGLAQGAGAQTPPPLIKVACIGDSITYGYNLPGPATQSYPANLGRLLGTGYIVQNFGLSGRCMIKKGNQPYWNEPAFAQSQAFAPDIVVIQLGTNDTNDNNEPLEGAFVADYESMVAIYRALPSHPIVYVCLPPPIAGEYGLGYSAFRLQTEVMPRIRQVSADTGAPIVDNFTLLSSVPQDILDTIHPNVDGAIRLAVNVCHSIAPPGSVTPSIVNDNFAGIGFATTVPGVPAISLSPTGGGGLLGGFTWDKDRTAGDIGEDLYVSRTYGDSVTYPFVGTGIDFISELSPQGASVDCYVDGQLVRTVSCYTPNLYAQQAVFSDQGLPFGSHTFQAIHRGPANATDQAAALATTGIRLNVDAFRVYHPIADYTLTVPASVGLTLSRGGTAQTSVTVSALNGYVGATTFQVQGLPAGVTATFSNLPMGAGSTALTLTATGTAVLGPVSVLIEGDCGPTKRFVTLMLTVTPTPTHLLWNEPDGRAILWSVHADGTFTNTGYGPYSDSGGVWRASSLSVGPDGVSHLLWTKSDGHAVLWAVQADGTFTCPAVYGPYADSGGLWTAASVATGPDGVSHLLWTKSDGHAVLWAVHTDGTFTYTLYGPYSDGGGVWRATALSVGGDNVPHLLWTKPDGHAVLWNVHADGTFNCLTIYGPYANSDGLWTATSVATGPDGFSRLLWTKPDGHAALWSVHADGTFAYTLYGPYSDSGGLCQATSLSVGADNVPHLLWTEPDGHASLWNVQTDGTFTYTVYGPYSDSGGLWRAMAVSAGL